MGHPLFRKKDIATILRDAESGLSDAEGHQAHLKKILGVRDLTALGVAAVVGAGIFSSIGKAAYQGGPAVIFLYIFTAIACGFAALCYAEFASSVPVSGSAYTYSYVAFGELIAWIIGWDLLMEYAIGNIAVAISWSDYLTTLLNNAGLHIASWLSMDFSTAHAAFETAKASIAGGIGPASLPASVQEGYHAWLNAPRIGSLPLIFDLPALFIVTVITAVVYIGIKESRSASNIMVGIKLAVVLLVIIVGACFINTGNWIPFAPNGSGGVLSGVSAVFFAYIGFDAISTTAEECKNPQRDLPRGMIYSLIICTVLYVLVALVLTGMVKYTNLNVGDPLAMVFTERGLHIVSAIVAASAIVATASVLLVFQIGQPRIWMSMSRDGLLPKIFSRIHPRFGTPSFSTVLTGIVVAVPALFLNLDTVLALTSIGTLFAFVLVCAGILVMNKKGNPNPSRFKVPYISGQYIFPTLLILSVILILCYIPGYFDHLFHIEGIPMIAFWLVMLILAVLTIKNKYSLIPVLGLTSCFYLMAQESHTNWMRFGIWLVIGLFVYFLYGYKNSKLNKENQV
ncbi:MAG TPA: amino acid permease [Edaphocola sp.]|nr:amino acid permease [Edaphocola sp.]